MEIANACPMRMKRDRDAIDCVTLMIVGFRKKGGGAVPKRQVKASEFLSDMRAGMDDSGLMYKYALSAHEILKVISKLIWAGFMSPTELEQRRSLAKTVYMPIFKCSSCNQVTYTTLENCPHCNAPMKNLNKKEYEFIP